MQDDLRAWYEVLACPVRVSIAEQQHKAKKHHANGAHTSGTAELGQYVFRNDGLNEKQQKCT